MLRDIVNLSKLDPKFFASLFGVTTEQFYQWMDGLRSVPGFLLPEMASVLGVPIADLVSEQRKLESAPAIWYKLRAQQRSSPADLEIVGLVRKLCFHFGELQPLLGQNSAEWDEICQSVRIQIDQSAPIGAQARKAAELLRQQFRWDHGSNGVGQFIRPLLRRSGVVIVESPVLDSQIEGCSFRVKTQRDITSVFANSYQSTWFRRNYVIMHEVCHAIFDLEGDPVSIDYHGDTVDELKEKRANLFAQECLVPNSVLIHMTNRFGISWDDLSEAMLAQLAAACDVEPRLALKAALDADLITTEQLQRYIKYDVASILKDFTDRALTTREFLAKVPKQEHRWYFQDRFIKIGNRGILLPVGYVKAIIELLSSDRITLQRAAELTMTDRYTFRDRFGSLMHAEEVA